MRWRRRTVWPLGRALRAVWATAFALLAGGLTIVLDAVRSLLGL
jgi:hypothetical protein